MSARRVSVPLLLTACCALAACGDPESLGGSGPDGAPIRVQVLDPSVEQMVLADAAVLQRLLALGVDESEVKVVEDELHVYAPGADDGLLREALHGSAELEFRPVLAPPLDPAGGEEPTPRGEVAADEEVVLATEDGTLYRLGPAGVTGAAIESAEAGLQGTQWAANVVLKSGAEGIGPFNELASQCYQGEVTCPATTDAVGAVAIVWNNVVLSAPTIQQPTFERDQISISGTFDERSATVLAAKLASASKPVELRVLD